MRCDLPRIPRNARSLLCATKASATDQSTLPPRPDGTTRLPSRRPRALRGGGSAQPIKGCSSEITARDSLRPRVVKANPSPSGRGYLIADGARRRPRAGSRCHSARRSPGRRLSRASCQAFLPLAIYADGRTLGGTGAPFLRQGLQPHRPDARTSTTSQCQQLS